MFSYHDRGRRMVYNCILAIIIGELDLGYITILLFCNLNYTLAQEI